MKISDNQKLFPRWFLIWFYISLLVLAIGGIIDLISGNQSQINALAAAIGIFIEFLIVLVVWKYKDKIKLTKIKSTFPLVIVSIIIGWIFSEIAELVNYPFNPLTPGITLTGDILATTPMYILAHLMWFFILKKYNFTYFQSFITGGISLMLFEVFFGIIGGAGAMILVAIPIWPFMVMIHGAHMIMPKILLNKEFNNSNQKESRWKYFWGILLPVIGTILGIIIAGIIGEFFGFTI